jgi:L-alanine-DL-glutamate epimerase-like enolase superfamily enzyme
MNDSLWTRIADLPLVVDSHALERLAAPAGDNERVTTHVRLRGKGAEGLGEDIGGVAEEHEALIAASPSLPLEGEWTLASFLDHLAGVDLWPQPPEWEMARRWRNWAFESAALDLALRQAGLGLPEALGRTPAPVQFVNSLGLGDPPELATVGRRLERYPELRFKLDAHASWSPELIAGVAATGAVDVIDFKGRYGLPVEDELALVAMYEGVLDRFDGAILEDPHDRPDVEALIAPHAARVSFDAPIATTADVEEAAFGARIVNLKPSRIGSLRALLDVYAHCAAGGLRMYGGGMGEIGVGRGQIQLLAALFHPDAPNDVAPSAYNRPELPPGLPESPLTPPARVAGFRWEEPAAG